MPICGFILAFCQSAEWDAFPAVHSCRRTGCAGLGIYARAQWASFREGGGRWAGGGGSDMTEFHQSFWLCGTELHFAFPIV